MNELHALLRTAARRVEAGAFLARLHQSAIAAAVVVLALMFIDRAGAASIINWWWAGGVIAVLTLLATVIRWRGDRKSETQTALLVDERLDLREKLSTALHVHHRDDPFARAAVEDALAAARDPKQPERIRRQFRIESPRGWWISPVVVLVALIVSMLPQFDLFTREVEEQIEVVQTRLDVAESLDAVVRSIENQPELREQLADMLGELSPEGLDDDKTRTPDQMRREAIKRVTDLSERLREILEGEQGKTKNALSRNLRDLQTPPDGPGKELAEALQAGDFKAAREALQNLMDQLKEGDLTPEQQQQLAEQLENLARQLENLAQRQQELEDALRRAGLDPQLAGDPEALQRAIENSENLNEQQKQQIQQMAQAQQQAAQMCQGLGAACQSMAAGLQSGQFAEGGQAMMDQISEMEALQMLLMQAEAAANACAGSCEGLGSGLGLQASLQQWMQGQGMSGQGGGGGPRPVAPSPIGGTRIEQAHGETREGDIIARMLVDGPQIVGESRIVPGSVVTEVIDSFEQGMSDERLPRKYHEALQHYFGELERRLREREAPASDE